MLFQHMVDAETNKCRVEPFELVDDLVHRLGIQAQRSRENDVATLSCQSRIPDRGSQFAKAIESRPFGLSRKDREQFVQCKRIGPGGQLRIAFFSEHADKTQHAVLQPPESIHDVPDQLGAFEVRCRLLRRDSRRNIARRLAGMDRSFKNRVPAADQSPPPLDVHLSPP
ncbi:hypothetical protein [Paraburkholderia sp. GAS42]|uniref:hypothetical protein n=1 Tax=Paraburkholderia sp. GAS42 TaxID=3035135 RepID=UPI003D1D906C